jgi:hypothetical protein
MGFTKGFSLSFNRIYTSIISNEKFNNNKGKGKAIPLQALTCPGGSRRLRLTDFKKTAHEGGNFVSSTHQPPLSPGNILGIHFCERLVRPQGHSATGRIRSTIVRNVNNKNQI